ncbi:FabD/lysophospholipase-like protein [Sporormia fimetaria CBS 119925]|uniref:FabD/lysophospholipase-like protein n=1 Tax=Sporormia fimetaria CBS 119925 TaxID=1340428 RepID=A0A6A6UUK2_9PLEO|nr:FabD/lysophospholipase-like protein [Sporormia fimetaria CBS 119925]
MTRLNNQRRSMGSPAVKPCEVFDLIGGTSTGGLIAIMLGRLEMDVDDCIAAYTELMEMVFGEKKRALPVGWSGNITAKFDSQLLQKAIKQVLTSRGLPETALFDDGVERSCKVFVCTTSYETKGIKRLRRYTLPDEVNISCTIIEAALATSTATSFFDVAKIGNRKFVDGALGANNPIVEVEDEAAEIWSSEHGEIQRQVKCCISVGSGDPGTKAINDQLLGFLSETLKDIAVETERTVTMFISRWRHHFDKNRYFRFNVQQGLQDVGLAEHKEQGLIEAVTEDYLTHQEQKARMRQCVLNLKQRRCVYNIEFT